MTEANRDIYTNQLRFKKDLEYEFDRFYYTDNRKALRHGAMLLILVGFLMGIHGYFSKMSLYFVFNYYGAFVCAPIPLVVLTFFEGFRRFWQVYLVCFIWGLTYFALNIIADTMDSSDSFSNLYLIGQAFSVKILLFMAIFIGGRLKFFHAVFVECGIIGIGVGLMLVKLHVPSDLVLKKTLMDFIPALIGLLFLAYTLERSQRRVFLANHLLDIEKAKSEDLLSNILPDVIAERLKSNRGSIADYHEEVSVLFADFVGFTSFAANKSPGELVKFLNTIFSVFDHLVEQQGLEKIKTVGDCYMVIGGAPTPRHDHLQTLAYFALAVQSQIAQMSEEQGYFMQFRIGMHIGPLVAGVIGEKRLLYDVWGDTVNIASRLESHGVAGRIHVSAEVAHQLQDKFILTYRGPIEIKGKGILNTYFLDGVVL